DGARAIHAAMSGRAIAPHPEEGEARLEGRRTLTIGQIAFSGFNPRKRIDPDALQELARDIAQRGILENLLVRPLEGELKDKVWEYELVFGERRLRAAMLCAQHGWP